MSGRYDDILSLPHPSSAELSSRMKNGKYHLHRRNSGLMIDSYGNTPAVIYNSDGIILVDGHINIFTIACQSFIYGIVHNLIYQMMKSS